MGRTLAAMAEVYVDLEDKAKEVALAPERKILRKIFDPK